MSYLVHLRTLAQQDPRVQRAQAKSDRAAESRRNLAPGTSRARVTSANARWSIAAEARDRILARVEAELRDEQIEAIRASLRADTAFGGLLTAEERAEAVRDLEELETEARGMT